MIFFNSTSSTTIQPSENDATLPDYGLIVTIVHLSLYLILLLGVSIVAVFGVRKEVKARKEFSKQKWKWYTPIKMWFQSVQRKRKVYIMLLPHLFDQAVEYSATYMREINGLISYYLQFCRHL